MFQKILSTGTVALLALIIVSCSQRDEDVAAQVSSVLITNANIVDGTGSPAFVGTVRIEGELIVAVGVLEPEDGERVFNANGLVLAPGFIDTHSHHDYGLRENPDALPLLTQGITTAVFGQDGDHAAPLVDMFEEYEKSPVAVNIASYAGHNTIRSEVMGDDSKRIATGAEIEAMGTLLKEELDAGAIGLSSGLEYEPGLYSTEAEVLALARVTAENGGRYISHIRSEDRFLWEAVEEIINIGKITGMPVQISHIKLAAKALWGESVRLIERLEKARSAGVDITADIYPYEYWQSTIWVLLPGRDADDLEEIKFVLDELTPADGIIFTRFEPNPDYVNKSVAEIAQLRGVSEVQATSDLMKEARVWSEANDGKQAESILGKSMHERDIKALLQWSHINLCTDGGYTGHPRGHGAFPRVFARYVRNSEILRLERAVALMTSQAAQHMGINNRGTIKPGYKADLVLFDPETIQDHAGIKNGQLLSTGISKVWVNGQIVFANGEPTAARPGQVIKGNRGDSLPNSQKNK